MFRIYLILGIVYGCHAYPSGAPSSACSKMIPDHGVPPQNTSSPYVIILSSSNFTNQDNLTITITSRDGNLTFKGFLVEVFTDQGTPTQFKEGEFTVPSIDHTTCSGGATHSNSNPKNDVKLTWKPTENFTGKLKFKATVVQAYSHFWTNIESELLFVDYTISSTTPSDVTSPSPVSTTTESPSRLPRCQSGFGCFKACPQPTCDSVVLWRRTGNYVDFRIKARLTSPSNRWVAIGFSPSGKMSRTSVVMCINDNSNLRVEDGFNNGYSFQPLANVTLGLTNVSISMTDQILTCSFSRQINVTGDTGSVYSLANMYYLLLGNGPVSAGRPAQHEKIPVASRGKVDFLLNENVASDDPSMVMYKLHGSLMILAWMFLSSVGIITARYYKSEWKDMMPCGVKVWFVIHRTLMSSVFVVTTAAFVIIFIHVGSLLQETGGSIYLRYHPALGITVMALSFVNPVMALFRCGPGHKYRHVFHYSHMFVGTAAQIVAAIAIYFGVNLEKSKAPVEASYIVKAYIITYVFIVIVLECEKFKRKRNENDTEREVLLKSASRLPYSQSKREQSNSFKQFVLMVHFLCMFMYCLVLIYFVSTA
ncbi:putative ferric-chelate reductase 1 isoform X2 [Crassostrea virginica]